MTTEYTIPIELPEDVAAEWEPKRYGQAKLGEHYFNEGLGKVLEWKEDHDSCCCYLILRRKWQWPKQIRGDVYSIESRKNSEFDDGVWFYGKMGEAIDCLSVERCRLLGVEPPPPGKRYTRPEGE